MLCNIDHGLIEDARRILTFLCFAPRPLTVRELIDGIAVETNHHPGLNRKRRLQDSNDIQEICPGFIDIGLGADHTNETYRKEKLIPTVRIAHFSVQEYLESDRIRHQKATKFSLTSVTAHAEIAKICLIYLLEPALSSPELNETVLEEYPMAQFAARYWYHHYKNMVNPTSEIDHFILRLFQRPKDSFATWVKLHNMDRPWDISIDFSLALDNIAGPVYYASLLGLDQALYELINTEKLEGITVGAISLTSTSKASTLVNARGGSCGYALHAASAEGHEKVVQLLLDNGAEIDARVGKYSNALHVASAKGHEKVVQLLLDNGAEVNTQFDESLVNVLQAASAGGHEKVVQLLLENGAEER